jgi:hypothetical protein
MENILSRNSETKDFKAGALQIAWRSLETTPNGGAIQTEGYTIIDIGYPSGVATESAFYNMEINIINW